MTSSATASLLYFNGTDDKIDVGYNNELNPQTFTIEAWAYSRTSNTGIERSVLTSRPDSYRWGYMFYQACYQDNWELWLLPPNGDYQKIRGPKVQANVWTHLAATYDPGSSVARFYINGQQVAQQNLNYQPSGPTGSNRQNILRIGSGSTESGYCVGGNYFFNGYIDEVRVWNSVRSAQDIQAKMNQRLTGQEANLVAYWRLSDISGAQVSDLTGHGHNGNICKGSMGSQTINPPFPVPTPVPTPVPFPVPTPVPTPPPLTSGQFDVVSTSETGYNFTNTSGRDMTFTFYPSGEWKPAYFLPYYTAAGETGFPYQQYMVYPQQTSFALLAIDLQTNTVLAEINGTTQFVIKPGQTVAFRINDVVGCYADNYGTLTVQWSAV